MLNIEPRDLAGHYRQTRQRLMTPRPTARQIIVIDEQAARIAELESENGKFRAYLAKHKVDPEHVLSGSGKKPEIPLDDIIQAVCEHYGVSTIEIRSARRHGYLLIPRHVVCYLARHLTLFSMPQIGRKLGNRDHTTILHGDRRITKLIKTDPDLALAIESIRLKLTGGA